LRDIGIAAFIFGLLPFVLKRPWIGVLMYVWVSVMNVQHFGYSIAMAVPFALVIAAMTMVGMVTTKEQISLPINATTVLLIVFPLWMCVTYAFALEHQIEGYTRWKEVMKILFFIVVSASILKTRQHIHWLIWIIVISVGFYGVKGGIFTIASGGSYRVWGPPGNSSITDNNSISVALVMMIPLMFYLRSITPSKWIKLGLAASIGLSLMAILGSHSRGAFLAVLMMVLFLWLKSQKKFLLGILLVASVPLAIGFMPAKWTERMRSIEAYQQDGSAMGRINAWKMAINVANDRPLVGGGFELYTARTFAKYAPDALDIHAAHSIYFQMLGEHGYVGLLLFLSLGFVGWANGSRIIKLTQSDPEKKWAGDLARMIQVSLVGFAVGGLFVNIGYWEIHYYLVVALMVMRNLVQPQTKSIIQQRRPQENFVRS
jgi:putative inorganic carbon (hco3(-)) transporter